MMTRPTMMTGCGMATTPRGGTHYFFRKPEGIEVRNSVKVFADGVDVRTDGGYVIVAPSTIGGVAYRWISEPFGGPDSLPEPPEFVLERFRQMAELQRTSATNVEYTIPTTADASRIMDYIRTTEPSVQGQNGSGTTFGVLGRLWHGFALSAAELAEWARVYNAEKCDPPWSEKELAHKVDDVISRWQPRDGRPRGNLLSSGIYAHDDADSENSPVIAIEKRSPFQADIDATESEAESALADTPTDPGPMPEEWFYEMTGFVRHVMMYSLDYAPHPNAGIAFAGAVALLAALTGHVIRDTSDIRTNLYILGLGLSASGKDFPRKVNQRILDAIGQESMERNKFASGEAIEDMLASSPVRFCQTDEINTMIEQVATDRGGAHKITSAVLLEMYSASNGVYTPRSKAGPDDVKRIRQPHLVIFGTAIPRNYFSSLSEKMLSNGLLSRMVVIEGSRRSDGNDNASVAPIPEVITRIAANWIHERPKPADGKPNPYLIPYTSDARAEIKKLKSLEGKMFREAEADGNDAKASVWGRVVESALKLALLYTASENFGEHWRCPAELVIGAKAVEWGARMAVHQVRRTLWYAWNYQSDSLIQTRCQAIIETLRKSPNRKMTRSELLRKNRSIGSKEMDEVLTTLEERGEIERPPKDQTGGRPKEIISLRTTGMRRK